jgi:hypothetical protein
MNGQRNKRGDPELVRRETGDSNLV